MRDLSDKGAAEIVGHEGLCLRPYLDSVGVWTIGAGSTASEGIDIRAMSKTEYQTVKWCMDLFKKGRVKYVKAVNEALKVGVSQEQFDALVSICYNIGTGGLKGSTFIKRINAGESKERVAQAILMWAKPPEILGRRKKEAKLFTDGVYSNGGKALQFDTNGAGKVSYRNGKTINVSEVM